MNFWSSGIIAIVPDQLRPSPRSWGCVYAKFFHTLWDGYCCCSLHNDDQTKVFYGGPKRDANMQLLRKDVGIDKSIKSANHNLYPPLARGFNVDCSLSHHSTAAWESFSIRWNSFSGKKAEAWWPMWRPVSRRNTAFALRAQHHICVRPYTYPLHYSGLGICPYSICLFNQLARNGYSPYAPYIAAIWVTYTQSRVLGYEGDSRRCRIPNNSISIRISILLDEVRRRIQMPLISQRNGDRRFPSACWIGGVDDI